MHFLNITKKKRNDPFLKTKINKYYLQPIANNKNPRKLKFKSKLM